jgi:hypothetical protein
MTQSQIFKTAHKIAREWKFNAIADRNEQLTYSDLFSVSLKMLYSNLKGRKYFAGKDKYGNVNLYATDMGEIIRRVSIQSNTEGFESLTEISHTEAKELSKTGTNTEEPTYFAKEYLTASHGINYSPDTPPSWAVVTNVNQFIANY